MRLKDFRINSSMKSLGVDIMERKSYLLEGEFEKAPTIYRNLVN